MKTIEKIDEANSELLHHKGKPAQLYRYSTSLGRLVLKISDTGDKNALYLITVSTEFITGPTFWENSNLFLYQNQKDDKQIVNVIDKKNGFELVASGGFSMVYGNTQEIEKKIKW